VTARPTPYSHWLRAGDFVIISGQLGFHTQDGKTAMADGGTAGQLKQALVNAKNNLEAAGATMSQVVKATLYILDMADFQACNEVWVEAFTAPLPTRTCIAVHQLPLGAHAEVELWAYSPKS
jgi:2-iminobutanoate/2-iminopropanoate deaminase